MITSSQFQQYPLLAAFRERNTKAPDAFSIKELAPKDYLITANTASDMNLFLILSGICVVQLAASNLKETCAMPYHIFAGNYIGAREIIFPVPAKRFADVIATTDVTVLCIKGSEFYHWQATDCEFYNSVLANILEKEYSKNNLLYQCALLGGTAATAFFLHHLYVIYQKSCYPANYKGPVHIRETHHDLSTFLARNTRTIDRAIRFLSQNGLISIQKGSIYIDSVHAQKLYEFVHSH